MMKRNHLIQSPALTFFLSLIFASAVAAQDVVTAINKQAWKIDPAAGSPARDELAGLMPLPWQPRQ